MIDVQKPLQSLLLLKTRPSSSSLHFVGCFIFVFLAGSSSTYFYQSLGLRDASRELVSTPPTAPSPRSPTNLGFSAQLARSLAAMVRARLASGLARAARAATAPRQALSSGPDFIPFSSAALRIQRELWVSWLRLAVAYSSFCFWLGGWFVLLHSEGFFFV